MKSDRVYPDTYSEEHRFVIPVEVGFSVKKGTHIGDQIVHLHDTLQRSRLRTSDGGLTEKMGAWAVTSELFSIHLGTRASVSKVPWQVDETRALIRFVERRLDLPAMVDFELLAHIFNGVFHEGKACRTPVSLRFKIRDIRLGIPVNEGLTTTQEQPSVGGHEKHQDIGEDPGDPEPAPGRAPGSHAGADVGADPDGSPESLG